MRQGNDAVPGSGKVKTQVTIVREPAVHYALSFVKWGTERAKLAIMGLRNGEILTSGSTVLCFRVPVKFPQARALNAAD